MCKICIARRLVVDISCDAMRILCLSLAGRWWRAECETGELGRHRFQFYGKCKQVQVDLGHIKKVELFLKTSWIIVIDFGAAHKLIGNALPISARVGKAKLAMNLVHYR